MSYRACPTCGSGLPADAPESLCPRCLLRVALEGVPPPAPARFSAPSPAELAPHFPQLEIESLIGQGGMGAVYKARQKKLDRTVALKILPISPGTDPTFAERFVREARALARLQHPGIVTLHDFGEVGGYYYLLMEHIDGRNLRQLMRAGPVAPDQAEPIIAALADALAYAHQHEVIHRDLKPENVLIDRRGQVKLADFGLAKLAGHEPGSLTLTGADQAMGTPHYMAPEQLERPGEVDHRADLYSLGVVAYELLTGELPLGRFDPPSKRSAVRSPLDAVVMRSLERDPARRFSSAADILAALRVMPALHATRVPPSAATHATSPEYIEPANERLTLIGVTLALFGIVFGMGVAKSGWLAFGLIFVERFVASVNWRPGRRHVVGILMVLAGILASILIVAEIRGMWWMIFVIWFWYGNNVFKFLKGEIHHDAEQFEEVVDKVSDFRSLSIRARRVLKEIHEADEDSQVTYAADLDGKALAKIRQTNELLPEERILAMVPLSRRDQTASLLITDQHVYFPATQNGEAFRCSLSYESLAGRSFVDHGEAVYTGDGVILTPENKMSSATLAAILNAVQRAVASSDSVAV